MLDFRGGSDRQFQVSLSFLTTLTVSYFLNNITKLKKVIFRDHFGNTSDDGDVDHNSDFSDVS